MRLALALLLAGAPPVLAADRPARPALDEDKLICKRQVETGSLVRAKKTCMTRKDWQRQVTGTQDEMARTIVNMNSQAPQ